MSEQKKKEVFTVKVGDKDVKLAVRRPEEKDFKEAQKVYNSTFADAIQSRATIRPKVQAILREQNVWTEEMQKEADELQNKIMKARKLVSQNGKVDELKEIAFTIRKDSKKLRELNNIRNSLDNNTAEAQAEAARFNKLVSLCTVYDDSGKPYFSSYDDLLSRANDPITTEASTKLMYMYYNLDPNAELNLPENKFLYQWGFINKKCKLINKDGKLVNEDGKLVDENDNLVDENGNLIDAEGNILDKNGSYVGNKDQQFLDENGNPVQPPVKLEAETEPAPSPAN